MPLEEIQATRSSTSGALDPADSFPQSSYTRWTTHQYTECCLPNSQRQYHTIPVSGEGSSGTNYDETVFGYDVMKRQNRRVTPGGTINRVVFDARGNPWKLYTGTDDTGATDDDPTGGGAGGNNMVLVTLNQFDGGTDGGDGNLTQVTQYVDGSTTRVTDMTYDFRNRRIETDGEVDYFAKTYYDNLDRQVKAERYNTTSGGNLIERSETKYDDRSRVYQSIRYGVDPSTGSVGNSLTDNTWYDASGRVIKQLPAGSQRFTKTMYDGAGRATKRYVGYDLDETTYAKAETVTGDTILQQNETGYDAASNSVQSTTWHRYHNATGTGELNGPSGVQPKARVVYAATWPDAIGRVQATADYGTNGGSTLARPSTIPVRSDNVLVTSLAYDSAGNRSEVRNPGGVLTCYQFDDRGRELVRIMNCSTSSSSSSSSSGFPSSIDTDITVQTAYNADGNVFSITAVNSLTGNQTTQFIYGTTLSDSDIASSLLKRAEIYPDSVDNDDRITLKYNRQGEVKEQRDQNGTVHGFDYDLLGRRTQDRVTTLGTGVDGAVRRIESAYEVRGMLARLSSWDAATVGSGSVVNEVTFVYNGFGQEITEYQSHSGTVNTSTTPKVQYGYANGSANTIRPTTLTYPDGRVLTYSYGSGSSTNDAASRVQSLVDDDMSSTHLADYSYLGLATFVEVDYTEPDVKYTLIGTAGGNDPDTGDIYRGLDRFGRIKDSYWYNYGSSADVDRIKYGYDRNGNRLWRENTVAAALGKYFDELYGYDHVDRLQNMDRGQLAALKDSVTNLQFAQDWSLDETGNWRRFREDDNGAGWDLDQLRTANKVNEIMDVSEYTGPSWATPVYSRAGNMTTIAKPADRTQSFTATYDAWDRLVRITSDAAILAEYQYDGAHRQVIRKPYSGGSLLSTSHVYYSDLDTWQLLELRLDESSAPAGQFVWGLRYIDDITMRERDTTADGNLDERTYALQDANWNSTSILSTNGTVEERYAYSAYGSPMFLDGSFVSRASSLYSWEHLFAAYPWQPDTGCYSVRYRSYNPELGWLQRDPIAALQNLYDYVGGQALRRTDPFGLLPFGCETLTSPCLGNAIACACGLIELFDTYTPKVIPPQVQLLLSGLDCFCSFIDAWAQTCQSIILEELRDDPRGPGCGEVVAVVDIGGVFWNCAIDVVQIITWNPNFMKDMEKLGFWFENLSDLWGGKCGSLPPGIFSCRDFFDDCLFADAPKPNKLPAIQACL